MEDYDWMETGRYQGDTVPWNYTPKKRRRETSKKQDLLSQDSIDALLAAAGRLQSELDTRKATKESLGDEPEEFTVVVFSKMFSPRTFAYTYAAIRIRDNWYITQSSGRVVQSPMSWDDLVEFTGVYEELCTFFAVSAAWDVKLNREND